MESEKLADSLEKVLNSDLTLSDINSDLMKECFDCLVGEQDETREQNGLDFKKFLFLLECLFVNKQKVPYYLPMQWKIELFHIFDKDDDKIIDWNEFRWAWDKWITIILKPRSALIIVDVQNDFISGSLAVHKSPSGHRGEEIVPLVNLLVGNVPFHLIAFSIDWHPANHISFYENLQLRKFETFNLPNKSTTDKLERNDVNIDLQHETNLYDTVIFEGPPRVEQKLWPSHCIQQTWGAELHSDLNVPPESIFVYKGTNSDIDSYSAFWDNQKMSETDLNKHLRERQITDVFVCGLAYDVCVASTAQDAVEYGYRTSLIDDASRGLNVEEIKRAQSVLRKQNALVVKSEKVADMVSGRDRKPELGYALAISLNKRE